MEENGEDKPAAAPDTELGTDPASGLPVTLKKGPYGQYIQLGDTNGGKPKRVTLPKGIEPESLTLDIAVKLLTLPREIGKHPDTGETISAGIGRFGPYLKLGSTFASLGADDDVLNIGLNRAVTVLAEAKSGGRRGPQLIRELGTHPDGGTVGLYAGRYGPYVSHDGLFASLPKAANAENFTLGRSAALAGGAKSKGQNAAARARGERRIRAQTRPQGKAQRCRQGAGGEASPIQAPGEPLDRVVGVFHRIHDGGRVVPADRRDRSEYFVDLAHAAGAVDGELVTAELLPARRYGPPRVRIVEHLGQPDAPGAISLLSIAEFDIPTEFPAAALAEAKAAAPPTPDGRADLRDFALVTIDGSDARDFDDAVWAEPDPDPENRGGWHLVVAIADVAHYVAPGSALDREAELRGNSVYFPDRVVPMLPEALSNGLCSLMPGEDRACLAAHLWIDAQGRKLRHRFERAIMRSAARLTYDAGPGSARRLAKAGDWQEPPRCALRCVGGARPGPRGTRCSRARPRRVQGRARRATSSRSRSSRAPGSIAIS